jgi:hypothetical protein
MGAPNNCSSTDLELFHQAFICFIPPFTFKTCIPYTYKATVRSATPLLSEMLKVPNPATPAPREPPSFDIASKEHISQDIVEEVLV